MNVRYLSNHPFYGYLYGSADSVMPHRERFNFRPLVQSLGWVIAGVTVGCTLVMLGAWGLQQLTERNASPTATTTVTAYQGPETGGSLASGTQAF